LADARNMAVNAALPCALALVLMSFGLAWLTIGMIYRAPGGQQPPRTPALGAMVSLLDPRIGDDHLTRDDPGPGLGLLGSMPAVAVGRLRSQDG
jgi:hypothetical protein